MRNGTVAFEKRGRSVAHRFNCIPRLSDMRLADALVLTGSGYRYVGDGGTDRREMLHDGIYNVICVPDVSSSILRDVPPSPNPIF